MHCTYFKQVLMYICLCSQNTGYKASTEGRVHSEHNLQRARSYSSWDRVARGGSQTRKAAPGKGKETMFHNLIFVFFLEVL